MCRHLLVVKKLHILTCSASLNSSAPRPHPAAVHMPPGLYAPWATPLVLTRMLALRRRALDVGLLIHPWPLGTQVLLCCPGCCMAENSLPVNGAPVVSTPLVSESCHAMSHP